MTAIPRVEGFWREFVDRYWESESVLLESGRTAALPRIEASELFDAVVSCVEDFCGGAAQKVRLFVDDSQVDLMRGGRQWLPRREDGSFEAYDQRIANQHGLKDYGLIVGDWHQFDRALWERIVGSVAALSDNVGVCSSRIDTQLFLGNYRITPFGVHVDPAGAFHFPVIGKKVMRFWPGSFAAAHPRLRHARRYGRFLADSRVVTAVPGEVIYWPSDHWHVGEADGEFSVTWRFAYWMADGMRQSAVQTAGRILDEVQALRTSLPEAPSDSDVGLDLVDELTASLAGIASSDRLRVALTRALLERYSAFGFLRVPPDVDVAPLSESSIVRLKQPFRILTAEPTPGTICVAAAGRSRLFQSSPELESAIRSINSFRRVRVNELDGYVNAAGTVWELIELCRRAGAVISQQPDPVSSRLSRAATAA